MNISDLSSRQVANALVIFAAALPFGADAVKGALMAAAAESSLLRFANNGESTRPEVWAAYGGRDAFRTKIRQSLLFSHDAVAGAAWTTADSVGLYQQRPSMGYGSIADLMDPVKSTLIFLSGNKAGTTRGFLYSPKGMSIAQRVQYTQGSEFPTGENYAPMETVAEQIISHFGGIKADPVVTEPSNDWITVATKDDVREAFSEANAAVEQQLIAANQQLGALNQRLQAMVDYQQGILEQQNAMNVRLDALVKNTAKE